MDFSRPQSAHTAFKDNLLHFGYAPEPFTPFLWRHKTNIITLTIVVDDFGIKYNKNQDSEQPINTLQYKYEAKQE